MKATLYFDGGARPRNPGDAGFAFVVIPERGKKFGYGRYIGVKTNNQAEYMGLIVGVKSAAEVPSIKYLEIVSDSKLVVHQLLGEWHCKDHKLKPLLREAQELLRKRFGDNWHITWVKGHASDPVNNAVDKACTEAILKGRAERRARNPFLSRLGIQ